VSTIENRQGIKIACLKIYNASSFVSTIENRQGIKIACLEEISLNNNWISKKELNQSIKFYGNCKYSNYLKTFL